MPVFIYYGEQMAVKIEPFLLRNGSVCQIASLLPHAVQAVQDRALGQPQKYGPWFSDYSRVRGATLVARLKASLHAQLRVLV
jgi:hypothetical protein